MRGIDDWWVCVMSSLVTHSDSGATATEVWRVTSCVMLGLTTALLPACPHWRKIGASPRWRDLAGSSGAALLPCNPSRPSCLSPAGHDYISSLRLCLRHAEFTSSSTRCCEVRQSWSVTANISICGAVSLDRCRLDSLTPDNLLSLISLSLSLTRK